MIKQRGDELFMYDQEGWKDHTNKTRTEKGLILYNLTIINMKHLMKLKYFLENIKDQNWYKKKWQI